MKLLLDGGGKIDYDMIQADTTVKDLLEAIDIFLRDNTLPCDNCEESCCKKAWSVEMDNVCVNRLSNWNKEAAVSFVQEKLLKKKNYYRDFNQYILRKEKNCIYITESNLCTIYEKRPVICRLYICSPKSYRYNLLRELVGSTYLKALIYEQKMRTDNFTERTIKKYKANPAVLAKDYDILLEDVFTYAEAEGWIDFDERQELY
ncbi:MAG: YkgJ family cysteine cluster protein [Bacillota bacterium]|nr:YkgJ family cysteine cluster protein [Bacillota bacterium]